MANDPHLSYSVPQLWYSVRLRISSREWVVGASIPGLPGVVLGRNHDIAWGLTNLQEDIDDLIQETLSADGTHYAQNGKWLPIEIRHFIVKIKDGPDQAVEAKFTHRGPLLRYIEGDSHYYSRQWLAFRTGNLRLPSAQLNRSTDWNSFNKALDEMRIPAQNTVYMDNQGNLGYRASGVGIKRKVSGMWVQPAGVGDWEGVESPDERPRLYLPADSKTPEAPSFIATANQRIYSDGRPQYWSSSQREQRIRTALSLPKTFEREDMERLQRDTYSRFHKELLRWIATHSTPKEKIEENLLARWEKWDGYALDGADTFSEALLAEEMFRDRLLNRVREAFLSKEESSLTYHYWLENAWMVSVLETEKGTLAFGVEENDLAQSNLRLSGEIPP